MLKILHDVADFEIMGAMELSQGFGIENNGTQAHVPKYNFNGCI